MSENYKNFYAVITAPILYSKELNARQKLLFAVITNMSNQKGYCFASNSHLAEITQTSTRTIQRDLEALEKLGFLGRVVKLKPNGEVEFRGLRPMTEASLPHDTHVTTPHDTSVTIKTNYSKNKKKNIYSNSRTDKNNQFRFYDWVDEQGLQKVHDDILARIKSGSFPPTNLLPPKLKEMLFFSGCVNDKDRLKLNNSENKPNDL